MDTRYQVWRKRIEEGPQWQHPVPEDTRTFLSPSGGFTLTTELFCPPGGWGYSRGIITRSADGERIAEVKRNYGSFWHCYVEHPNGNEYLLCGEDYQGYTTVNLTEGRTHIYFPDEGYDGRGFCWAKIYPSPDGKTLAVDGCYWACPYEIVLFDFQTPDELPYREFARGEGVQTCEGWTDNETFVFVQERDVRASDGKDYYSLSETEQAALDADPKQFATQTRRVELRPR